MKLQKLVTLCKKQGYFLVTTDEASGIQWMGDGCAIYPMEGFPLLDKETISTIFGLTEDQKSKTFFCCDMKTTLDLRDCAELEERAEESEILISYNGKMLVPVYTSFGVVMIDAKHLEPVNDLSGMYSLFVREGEENPYIVVKSGLIAVGVILPVKIVDEKFMDKLTRLHASCKMVQESEGD